jgi:hypothetical protein
MQVDAADPDLRKSQVFGPRRNPIHQALRIGRGPGSEV